MRDEQDQAEHLYGYRMLFEYGRAETSGQGFDPAIGNGDGRTCVWIEYLKRDHFCHVYFLFLALTFVPTFSPLT